MKRLPKLWPVRSPETAKTMRKKLFHEPFFIGHSYQAVAQIAGGNDIQVFTDTPSRTAIVGHGDDSRQIISLRLEATQHDRQARTTADDDDFRSLRKLKFRKDQIAEISRFTGHDDTIMVRISRRVAQPIMTMPTRMTKIPKLAKIV